ncbi:capsid cement protein [Mycolicibacterium fortuitum]|uniref:capsid cement protein n=1 Tax=Mycolicibacterium fortuitum TaxID=1766 RepID=UPI0034CF9D1C
MANEAKPLFRPGQDVTALTTGAVTGSTFVGVSATRDAATGLVKVATATAAAKAFGVASADIASGATGLIHRGGILFVTAGGSITAGAQVEVGSGGKAVTLASGVAVGTALETGSSNNPVLVALDL